MDDPYKYFRVEARELVEQLGKSALELEKGAAARDPVARLLRAAHTLKGAARVVKQREIADHAHAVEEALAPFRASGDALPSDRLDVVLGLLHAIATGVAAVDAPAEEARTATPASPAAATVADGVGTVRADLAEVGALLDGVAEVHGRLELLRSGAASADAGRRRLELALEELAPRRSRTEGDGARPTTERARVLLEEARAAFARLDQSLASGLEQIDRELRQVRDAAERLRLVPASSIFTSMERAALDVARAQSKDVAFVASGGDVRLGAHVLVAIEGALRQVVRNAVAHGIETPDERRRASKARRGTVELSVARRGRHVVFACRDDGRGIDVEAVRAVARRRGLVDGDASRLDAAGLVRLLLRGGLSTSASVTEVAGRGIGLDIVRDAAEQLAGAVDARTTPGGGTTIEIVVPISLASLEALAVEAGGTTAAVPLDAVRRTLRVLPAEIARTPRGATIVHEGAAIPFAPLARLLGATDASERGDGAWSAVVVEGRRGFVALGVERLLGAVTAVLRPVPELAPPTEIVAGIALDVRGDPQLVLDPDGLAASAIDASVAPQRAEVARPRILVVDDSLTTRMLEQSILESAGYPVEVAASAEEGLAKARGGGFALFLVDVEMPGMDGFTFVERTRADAELRDVPAILVTSRSAPEDRERGRNAGAKGYVVKGEFDQRDLLRRIRELTGGAA